ncbi:MAG TPA: hypothetical protein VF316_01020 [Polyangiaceae bacterium]
MKRTWGVVAVGLAGACVVAACGGGAAEAPSSSTPGTRVEGAPTQGYPPAPQGTTTVTPSATDETPTRPQPNATGATAKPPMPVDTYRVNARDELARAESELAAAPKDCASACRALASMERAAKSLCDLGGADECSQARARVEAARDRVRSTCGVCPGSR